MTKNRALKRAVRARASQTGETYVVARRNTLNGEPTGAPLTLGPIAGTLHRWTHRMPGVPAHTVTARTRTAKIGNRPHVARAAKPHPVREKRVLRGWQEWIEQRVTR